MINVTIKKQKFQKFILFGNKVLVRVNEQEDGDIVTCDELMILCVSKDYIVSSLIKANYPSDIMDAVRNNYELVRDGTAGDKTQEYTDEYLAMQEWRRYAKKLASEIIEEKERQHGN